MAKYYGNACISDGEYEKDGEKKKNWMTVGRVIQQDSGDLSIYFPLFDRWVNIFPKKQQQQQPQQQYQQQQGFTGNTQYSEINPPPQDDLEF